MTCPEAVRIALIYLATPIKTRVPGLDNRWIAIRVFRAGVNARIVTSDAFELLTLKELLVQDEYELSASAAPRVILDLGANIGVATLLLRAHYPTAPVVAVEPDPATFRKLAHNVSNDPKVFTISAAIVTQRGHASLAAGEMSGRDG